MLCACSGEQFKLEEAVPQSPESLATRDFSASGLSSRTGTVDWESKLEDAQVDEAESTLKEALSLNYEEARALLGRLEYQRVSLLLEAILLKAKSLAELGRVKEAARECKIILDTVESALPNGIYREINEDSKLLEMFHRALELLPKLWLQAGSLDEAITAYRRALLKPWNLDPQRLAKVQKDLAATLLYGGVEAGIPSEYKPWGSMFPKTGIEESILLLFILMQKVLHGEIEWDQEVMNHLTFALTISGEFLSLADHVEQVLPGRYNRVERWYFLALCYSAAGWKLLALIASAEQRLKDAEAIIDLALDETGNIDQLELLRLKAVIQIAQEQPKQAIETYRILLALIQGLSEHHDENTSKLQAERALELEAWLDLAALYSDHELWLDSDICIKKAKATKFYSPRCWHATGRLFEAQEQHKEAIIAFSVSLSIEPDYVPSIISTAEVLMKMGNKSLPIAKSFIMNALRLEPTNHEAWFNLGLIYKMEGLVQQAADSFQAAHELKVSAPVQSFH
ncbi:UNVERIFIED_CONTAM: protein NPGR1 [Sesamum radiatum]|uniref:Protein NPGR1 n=1 Tax=Sesamum radiatum TaxID=300843 RepID=A0AAW2M4G3_SESRA